MSPPSRTPPAVEDRLPDLDAVGPDFCGRRLANPDAAASDAAESDAADPVRSQPAPLDPPRFTIRALLLAMALFGVLLTMFQSFGGYATLLVVILVLAVAAHVAGNAIGTQLRDRSTQSLPAEAKRPRPLQQVDYAPKTNLAGRDTLGWPLVFATLIGILAGALAGALLFTHWETEKATWEDTLLGAAAFAMLGGMGTFVAAGFAQVMFRAWRQAEGRRDLSE